MLSNVSSPAPDALTAQSSLPSIAFPICTEVGRPRHPSATGTSSTSSLARSGAVLQSKFACRNESRPVSALRRCANPGYLDQPAAAPSRTDRRPVGLTRLDDSVSRHGRRRIAKRVGRPSVRTRCRAVAARMRPPTCSQFSPGPQRSVSTGFRRTSIDWGIPMHPNHWFRRIQDYCCGQNRGDDPPQRGLEVAPQIPGIFMKAYRHRQM